MSVGDWWHERRRGHRPDWIFDLFDYSTCRRCIPDWRLEVWHCRSCGKRAKVWSRPTGLFSPYTGEPVYSTGFACPDFIAGDHRHMWWARRDGDGSLPLPPPPDRG